VDVRARLNYLFVSAFVLSLISGHALQAQTTVPPGACLYALDPTASRAFQIAGAQTVYTACGVVSESNASDAFEMEGSEALYLQNHAQLSVVGGAQLNGQTLWDTLSNSAAQPVRVTSPGDPLASIVAPTSGTIVSTSHANYDMNSKPANNTLQPGVYCGGLTIGNTDGVSFTFSSGVYVMAGGGFVLNSQASVSGSGVTVYNTTSSGWGCSSSYSYTPITVSGQVQASLSAPTSGPLMGILFFGDRAACARRGSCVNTINGGSTALLNGALYAPRDELEITGSNASGYTMLVADKIYINGNSNFGENGSPFDGVTVSVSPATSSLFAGQMQQFNAAVNNSGNPAVTWNLSPANAGSISSSGLYTAPSPIAAQQTVTVTATSQADNTKLGTATITLLPRQTPVLAWPAPAPIAYGTALTALQLDATANVPGAFAYAPAAGTILSAGSQTLTVTFTPTNTTQYNSTTATMTLVVNKATPVITWPTPGAIAYGTALSATQLDATTNVPGTFAYSPAAGTIVSAGSQALSVTFTPTDGLDYTSATASVTLTVNKATPVITWAAPAAIAYGTALTATQLDATANVPGTFAYTPAPGTVLPAGNQALSVTFTPTDATNYSAATGSVALTVSQAPPVLTWNAPGAITYGTPLTATQLDATANVPGAFAYSPAAGTILSAGNQALSVAFTPTDAQDYTSATATATLSVNKATPVVTWPAPAAITYGTALSATQLDATTNVPGTFAYSPAAGTVLAAGTQTLTVTFTPTDATDYTGATASVPLTVNQAVSCALNGYSYGRAITIDHTQVPNTDQANFPFLFNTTDPLLATIANGGHVSSTNGYDILFTSDAAGQNPLSFEMEEYNPQTGQVIAWIKVPTLSHSQNTVIYLFYGNAKVAAPQQNPTAVWDANYMGVWHVANGTQLSLADSTSNANNGTSNGATATAGQIDGGMATDGTNYGTGYATIGTPASLDDLANGDMTVSAWVYADQNAYGGVLGKEYPGWTLGLIGGEAMFFAPSEDVWLWSSTSYNPNAWNYLTATIKQTTQPDGTQLPDVSLYINGVLSSHLVGNPDYQDDSAESAFLGTGPAAFGYQAPTASEDEFRISNVARAPDWIATEFANQNSPSGFYNLSPEGISVNPASAILYQGQSQLITASLLAACPAPITWTLNPSDDAGTITASGLYTAPASVSSQQAVTVTATSGSESATAVITLMPPVAVSVAPASVTLTNGDQQQQFTATVLDSIGSTAVTWSISPSGVGTLDQTGLYTAPDSMTAPGQVTVTATSQFDPSKSGSATITLTPPSLPPPVCASNGYSFQRAIVINHNLVPNTDQVNFPFLFNSTDPGFATTANGGHMANENAYDLMFSSDPAGQNKLNYELEEYNPVTGQIIAWIGLPNLSHSTDTVIYAFYGNAGISSSQQNPAAVWDSNFKGVWHVPNGTQLSLVDSTANQNNGTNNGALAAAGEIDGGMLSNGSTYATIGTPSDLANLAQGNATFSAWISPGSGGHGVILGKEDVNEESSGWAIWEDWQHYIDFEGIFGNYQYVYATSNQSVSDNSWSYVTVTVAGSPTQGGTATIYINGVANGTASVDPVQSNDDSAQPLYLGNVSWNWPFTGTMDEFRISNTIRSADWIAAEFNNQNSPSTFYGLYPENFAGSLPSSVSLYASQTEQFSTVVGCTAPSANWSMPGGSPGTLTTSGLYSAPASIATPQSVTIAAVSQADGSTIGNSVVNLMPPLSIGLSPATPTLYVSNETLQFTATLTNAIKNGVAWSISPVNLGTISQTGLYTAPYFTTQQTVTITATSVQNPTQSASATLTLLPLVVTPGSAGVYGGFTQQFSANVPVVWSLAQGTVGTIDQTGLFTAPANITQQVNGYVVTTVQSDPNASITAWVGVLPPVIGPVAPSPVSLIGGQSQAFNVCLANSASDYACQNWNEPVANWSISPAGAGSISSSGVYAAPALVPTRQTVTVTASDMANPAVISTGTITLLPPVVSLTPKAATLYAEEKQQFHANVTDSSNTAVTWTISPAGAGSINSSGLYTAPPVISSPQTVTVTATLQSIPSISASATITLSVAQCAAKDYSYVRPIVIDHTKVPTADQANFPFLFSVTDPALASTSDGGHVTSSNASDILFSSDPAGLQPLSFDLEQYNPATGQIAAWINVPILSHSSDTVIYMFYGNAGATASQQNSVAVWDANYTGVYQFEDLQAGTLYDSTINANDATANDVQLGLGQPGGAGAFAGTDSYISLPSSDFPSFPQSGNSAPVFNASFGVWFKTASSGVILGQTGPSTPGSYPGGWVPALYIDTNGNLRANFFNTTNVPQIVSSAVLNDNNWHHAVITFNTNQTTNTIGGFGGSVSSTTSGIETLYVDGQLAGQQTGATPSGFNSGYSYFLGTGYAQGWANTNNNWFYFKGSLDQVEVSSIARSGAWVQAEYNNQASPSTFFALGAEAGNVPSLNPLAVTLYSSQTQQFTVLQTGSCSAGNAAWSMPAGSPGTLSATGLYTAPASIATQQSVTLTATTLGANSTPLNSTITLMPSVAVTLTPGLASVPAAGTQQFTATVTNTANTAVTWSLIPAGAGSINATGLYTAPVTVTGPQQVYVIATSLADPSQSASASVTVGATAPPVAVAVNPSAATLYGGQTQQFTASVINTPDTAVTWSISPAGAGSIDANGFYTAPATISTQQTVMVIATSHADPTQSGSAAITLAPTACMANGYTYTRQILIDHRKVPNTDQANFPFLFSITDPMLAAAANGGHVSSANGYDIIFSGDPNGLTTLKYELEKYDPVTGQVIAWVRLPYLSHTSDTEIYLFYGSPNVTASQQNPAATWDPSYKAVWHLANGSTLSANDSTSNVHNGTISNATATAGQIDGAAAFDGSTSQISCGVNMADFQFTSSQSFTDSAWINLTTSSKGYMNIVSNARDAGPWHGLWIDGTQPLLGDQNLNGPNITINSWHYLVGVQNGGYGRSLYLDGVLVAQDQNPQDVNGTGTCMIGDNSVGEAFQGTIDEVRIAGAARSADWIAAEYNNQSAPSTFFSLSPEGSTGIMPAAVTLHSTQSQQFAAPGLCSAGVSFSLSADAPGTLTPAGLYTAPAGIAAPQTLTVTAASQANPSQTATATVTLMPSVIVAVAPASTTLNANQAELFTATVTNADNPAVTWSITPTSLGSIDQSGVYVAPSTIAQQQTVTITATSVTDPTKSASAMVTLAPSVCASTGYGYQRVIVIDHTKVANTDQVNFPFLFNTTDRDLATLAHGGHVENPNGYDIIFSADPNGQTRLDFEVEQYNPATGQLVAWMRIPTLSHTADTILYVFYGNPSITTTQANSKGVWDSNYQAVYHLGNLASPGLASDSTTSANDSSVSYLAASPGIIDGAVSLNGYTSYLQIPQAAFPSYPTGVYSNIGVNTAWNDTTFSATYGIWFKTASWGGLLDQTTGEYCTFYFGYCWGDAPETPGHNPDGSWGSMLDINFNGNLEGRGVGTSTQAYNDNNWHYATITWGNGVNNLYADGKLVSTGQQGTYGFSPNYAYFVGTRDIESDTSSLDSRPWWYLAGQVDEINVSSNARSGDWIQTQYNNQSSPSTFYTFYSPNTIQVAPSSISLYAAQSEQFVVPGTCDNTIHWSMYSNSAGTLSAEGLYTAPSAISTQQTVTVSATSQSNGSSLGSAVVTLLPPPQPLTLVASSPSPYQVATTQSFTATLLDPQGNPRIGATVNFIVAGVNGITGTTVTDGNGAASFTYTGSNSGTDSIEANASADGVLVSSNTVSAVWLAPSPVQAPSVTLLPQPSAGRGALMGAFTDATGKLIEPIVIGSAARTFITPAGATRLQLGIDDNYFEDNTGVGFVVAVNGVNVTVPPTAMPWNWKTGGLNNNYQYGINDGTSPVVAASSLSAGQAVTIAYQNGTITTDNPLRPLVDANGESSFMTGIQVWQGSYFPTMYATGTSYPQNQPISVLALVTDASGAPIPNVPVTITVAGANPGQYQAVSNALGIASFLYTGQYAGSDSLQAQATLSGGMTLNSGPAQITWVNYPTPPPVGSLSLNYILSVVNNQAFSSFAKDASGNPLANVNVGFYVTGVDNFQSSGTTNDIGQAGFGYYHTQSGNYKVIAVDSVGRNVIVTPAYTGSWTVPTGNPVSGPGGAISISISASSFVTMPNPLQLNATVTDSAGLATTDTWTEISGPGTVTFADPTQPVTTATFSQAGTYVLQLFANDSVNSGWEQITVTVNAPSVATTAQGWIGAPLYGSTLTGIVPITLAPGVSIASGTLALVPVSNPNSVTTLNAAVSGTGQIGTLDTTTLANGSYWLKMQATDTSNNSEYSVVLVTVAGDYKPGRVTTTVTDLVVPATGLPIQIQRTYDSLKASTSSDFGYGWSLGINVDLVVDPSGNVTFTLGGQRKTFYLTPKMPPCTIAGCLFPYYFVGYTPEAGLHGSLTDFPQGCPIDIVVPYGSIWECNGGSEQFNPTGYIYTDPGGTQYAISASGALQSITDRTGNGLTITPIGITSTTGLNVPFVRDSLNRITQITDPQGNIYTYGYDANGNLATVTYPTVQQPSTYTYDADHFYLSGTDFRNNPLPSTGYFGSTDTDPNGLPLNGRLHTVTDGLGETTTYNYDLVAHSTTITYPPDAGGNVGKATMVYDSHGNLLSSTDPLGHTTTNAYDASFNLLSTTDPLGHITSFTYDASGNKTSQTYPATASSTNTTSTTAYNQYSEPISVTDELGNVRTFSYDANYNPASITDSIGTLLSTRFSSNGTIQAGAIGYDISQNASRASQFSYDANGNLISKSDALGRTTSYTYDALGHELTLTRPVPTGKTAAAATTTYQYDAFGNVTQASAPLGRVTGSKYDANGNKTSSRDANGKTTAYQYDALNRLSETDYPDSTKATRTYDFRGNVITETDQGGHVTRHQYDLAGRRITITRAYGTSRAQTTTYTYDASGRRTSETDALGHTTTYAYDAAGNLTDLSGVKGSFQYGYDNARNRISVTDGNSNTTQFKYDARKRLIETGYPDGTKKTNGYDSPGNLISVTDQAGNQVQYTYDAANQLQTVVQVNSPNSPANTTVVGYDADGNPITLQDANLHTTTSSFDLLGEITGKTLPDATLTETRQYDQNGNLTSLTHFNGVTTTYTYDNLNRLLSRTTPNEAPVSFTYTGTGKRQTMTDASGTMTYSYDSMDRLITKATPEGTLSYTYDAAGNLASMSSNHTNGVSVTYSYDDLNRLTSVVDANLAGAGTTTYTYDTASNLGTVTYPNGIHTGFTYDQLNRVSTAVSQVAGYSYQRGPTGNLANVVELNGRTVNWAYDGIYRLTSESITSDPSKNNGSVSYGLDPVGNRLSASSSLNGISSGAWSFNADDGISSESYDANGNVIASGGKSFAYDSQNHLVSMNGGAVQILYDGDGNRVAKSANGLVTRYLVDDLNPTGYAQVVEELNGAGVVQRQYTYGLQRISQNQLINNTWTESFYGYDGGGNVRNLTDSAGAVTDTYAYDAFGNSWTVAGGVPNEMLYAGEQWDPDLNLYYLRARYYNPFTDRFLSRDPGEGTLTIPATLHKYVYADGDPVNGFDPTGWADEETYPIIISRVALAPAVVEALQFTSAAITCALIYEGTDTFSQVVAGYGNVIRVSPCLVIPRPKRWGPPTPFPPITLPISTPGTPSFGPPPPCGPGEDLHHLLPQQFRSWFAQAPRFMNVDSEGFTMCLPRKCHTGSGGVHSNQNGPGTNWNARWAQFIAQNPNASSQQVMNFLAELEGEFADVLNCLP
jgi:RHS repeat-associated protein